MEELSLPSHEHPEPCEESALPSRAKMIPMSDAFADLLERSEDALDDSEYERVEKELGSMEDRVYQLFTSPPRRYLSHMLSEADAHTQQQVQLLAGDRELEVEAAIYSSDLTVQRRKPVRSIRATQDEIERKLAAMSGELSELQEEDCAPLDNKHWQQDSPATQQAKQFVLKLNRQQRLARRRMRDEQKRVLSRYEQQQLAYQDDEDAKLKQRIQQSVDRLLDYRKRRQEERTKGQQLEQAKRSFLEKYKTRSQMAMERGTSLERSLRESELEERQQKLREIKERFKPIDAAGLEEHQRLYNEKKERMQEETNKRLQEMLAINSREEKLAQLYRGHFHEIVDEQTIKLDEKKEKGKAVLNRIAEYEETVLTQHKPKIDDNKKKELEQLKMQLLLKEKKLQRKVLQSGEVIYEPPQNRPDAKAMGKQYLEQLRKMHPVSDNKVKDSSKDAKAKPLSVSSASTPPSKKQMPDYIREGTKGLRATLSTWKKELQRNDISKEEKYNIVLKKVEVIDENARLQEEKLKAFKDQPKAIDIKESLDKHYLNSINAKLEVLNKVIYQ